MLERGIKLAELFDIPSDLSVPNSSPTPDDFAAVIFNEHRSAHGPDVEASLAALAHVLLNRRSAGIPFGKVSHPQRSPNICLSTSGGFSIGRGARFTKRRRIKHAG